MSMWRCESHGGHGFKGACKECNRTKDLRNALEWIRDACAIDTNKCICGRPTGVLAVHDYAKRALEQADD